MNDNTRKALIAFAQLIKEIAKNQEYQEFTFDESPELICDKLEATLEKDETILP